MTGSLARDDRYHYDLLTCCQAMYQLGGHYWTDFFPGTVDGPVLVLVAGRKTGDVYYMRDGAGHAGRSAVAARRDGDALALRV